jgi:hypothetical protein
MKNRVENDPPPAMLSGDKLLDELNKLPSIKWGQKTPLSQISGKSK